MRQTPRSALAPRDWRSVPHRLSGAAWAGRRVGLLGGSFDPAHAGHRRISVDALTRLRLDEVWWLVTPRNPLKRGRQPESLARRLAVARAVADHPRIIVAGLEQELGTRYTADTLRMLRQRYGRTRFVWMMGADNLWQIPRWRGWGWIFGHTPIAVFRRPPYVQRSLTGKAATRYRQARLPGRAGARLASAPTPAWVMVFGRLDPTSASDIRARRPGGG